MANEYLNLVWKHSKSEGTTLLLLLALADVCNENGVSYPGIAYLAKKCRIGERAVQKHRKILESIGEIEVLKGCGALTPKGCTNAYRITIDPTQGDVKIQSNGVNGCSPHVVDGVNNGASRGEQRCADWVNGCSPNPLREPLREPSEKITAAVPAGGLQKSEKKVAKGHKEFIEGWCRQFEEVFGDEYVFAGAKDGSAASRILENSKLSPEKLLMIARTAWTNRKHPKVFHCRNTDSIATFAARFNEVRRELKDAGLIAADAELASEIDSMMNRRGVRTDTDSKNDNI